MEKKKNTIEVLSSNRQAAFKYNLDGQSILCGSVLTGPLVKLAKAGSVSLRDAYCRIDDGILNLVNARFKDESPVVKLLINKKELKDLVKQTEIKGNTIIPYEVLNVNGWVKVRVRVATGKKKHDKRQAEKEKDLKRESGV